MDVQGRVHIVQPIGSGNKITDLDIGKMMPRFYFIKLSAEGNCTYLKMLKN